MSDIIVVLLIVSAFTVFAAVLAWVSRREPEKQLTTSPASGRSPTGARHA
ncbi:MAG: hypothetical protein JO001_23715 [Alphaproteobacteria bacterium]|nr:hypothetical protein [Alphaproteobacteria bacterium]